MSNLFKDLDFKPHHKEPNIERARIDFANHYSLSIVRFNDKPDSYQTVVIYHGSLDITSLKKDMSELQVISEIHKVSTYK